MVIISIQSNKTQQHFIAIKFIPLFNSALFPELACKDKTQAATASLSTYNTAKYDPFVKSMQNIKPFINFIKILNLIDRQ